jgi:putative ABC transport system permease protein
MTALRALIRNLFRHRHVERDLDEEVRSHLELLVEENVASGMRPTAARRAARLHVGSIDSIKEAVREARRGAWVEQGWQDVRYGFRMLARSPAFALTAVMTLALGIGANTVMFSIVDSVVIRALPYDDPDRLVVLWENADWAGFPKNTPAPGNFNDWRRMNRSFADMAATTFASASLTGDGVPEQILGRGATANFFSVLGVRPLLGRTFTESEDREGAQVVVISYGLWQRRYGGDPSVLGRTVLMNNTRLLVIGVMPRSFVFRSRDIDYWVPVHWSPERAAQRNSHFLNVIGRLQPGITMEAARDDMQAIARTLSERHPDTNYRIGVVLVPVKEEMLGNVRLELLILMASAAAVLLIACANLASLLLSRGVARQSELTIRRALGATRGRLIRQMMVEGLMLSSAGAAAGLAVVPTGRAMLTGLTPPGVAPVTTAPIDLRMLAFTFVLAVTTGLLFSLAPGFQASRASVQEALQQHGRSAVSAGGRLTRDVLVVLQIAAAVVLLVATGLMIRTLINLRATDLGFEPEQLLTMRTTLPRPKYADPQKRLAFYEQVVAGVKALPGVEHAAYASTLPFTSQGNTSRFDVEGRALMPGQVNDALYRVATSDYLTTLGVSLLEGRLIDDRDGPGTPRAVVINETLAREFFPNESPLGHRIRMSDSDNPFHMIVGVVHDLRERGYEMASKPGVYLSIEQTPEAWQPPQYLAIRARPGVRNIPEAVRRVIAAADPEQPVAAVQWMDDILDLEVADRHQQMMVLGAFAALALLLASLGLYGLLSYGVAQRGREIGLRLALGATQRRVVAMVAARGLVLTVTGLAIGVLAGWATTHMMSAVLYGVHANDPSTFAAVVLLLGTVGLAACVIPATRASRMDAMVALREE